VKAAAAHGEWRQRIPPTPHPHKGRRRKKKMKATYIWQMATIYNWGRYVPFSSFFFFNFWDLFYGVFVRFSTRGVQKHHKCFLGEVHVKSFWPKKLRKKNFFPVVFSQRFFLIAFLAVSLHEEPNNTTKTYS
jgi:hypothetical protein